MYRHFLTITAAALLASTLLAERPPVQTPDQRALEGFHTREQMLRRRFAQGLERLAQWCRDHNLSAEASQTRQWLNPGENPHVISLPVLPRNAEVTQADASSTPEHREWARRLYEQRRETASDLFSLARRAFQADLVSYAYDLVHEVAELDPDHSAARSLLGYIRWQDEWVTPFEAQKRHRGWVWHPRFGWLKRDHVPRYEEGWRWFDGKWIPADAEAKLRQDWKNAWQVRTDHYLIHTNHSLESGVGLAQKLEELYRVFQRIFAEFYTPQEQLAMLFEGRRTAEALNRPPFQVVYFRSREEYLAQPRLRELLGKNLDISSGAYVPQQRAAFFFHGDDSTLLHEATHQLFSESRNQPQLVGQEANFWIVEGIATYMETLRREGDRIRVGGLDAPRFRDARHRRLKDNFYIPLTELTRMGIRRFQEHPDLAALYSQSAGLTQFLMHFDRGRYRQALVQYLQAIYTHSDTSRTLSELTGTSYRLLDEQYLAYLRDAE